MKTINGSILEHRRYRRRHTRSSSSRKKKKKKKRCLLHTKSCCTLIPPLNSIQRHTDSAILVPKAKTKKDMQYDKYVHVNMKNRFKTIRKMFTCLREKKMEHLHSCSQSYCSPSNISMYLGHVEITKEQYDPTIWVCRYLQVHVCDHTCISKNLTNDGFYQCPITGQRRPILVRSSYNIISGYNDKPCDVYDSYNSIFTKYHYRLHTRIDVFYNASWRNELTTNNSRRDTTTRHQQMRIRNKKYKDKNRKTDRHVPDDLTILQILRGLHPIATIDIIQVYLLSPYIEYMTKHMTKWQYLISTGKWSVKEYIIHAKGAIPSNDISTIIGVARHTSKIDKNVLNVISSAENTLRKILPGIYRVRVHFFEIQTIQSKLYDDNIQTCYKNILNKEVNNSFHMSMGLIFDSCWKNRPNLIAWPTKKQWIYYVKVIWNFWQVCIHSGDSQHKLKSLDPHEHSLGVISVLFSGYSIKQVINGNEHTDIVVPKDIYLNTYGILLPYNKLSTFSLGRREQKKGEYMVKRCLRNACTRMSVHALRQLLFS